MTYHVFFNMKLGVSMEESETHGEPTPDAPKELDQLGEYCFETDRLALKGNSDYLALMRTLVYLSITLFIYWHTYRIFKILKYPFEYPLWLREECQPLNKSTWEIP